jgi:ubiquinone/menaquinone biosynthesis C-methylase UbiE
VSVELDLRDVGTLACIECRGALRYEGTVAQERVRDGVLSCIGCSRRWFVVDGLARLCDESSVSGSDWLLRNIYDVIAPFHDLGVDIVLPIIQYPDPDSTRQHYVDRLELQQLAPREDGPLRILEVGIGAGANLPLIEDALPPAVDVELWGLDLSHGMLSQCRRNVARRPPRRRLRVVLADAHALPFPDATFDRVFHVGAINGYRDRRRALSEMARVARPHTPIVVVDEGLDERRPHTLLHRVAFTALTLYDRDPRAPLDALPRRARHVRLSAVSRFYYCLRFET